MGCIPKLFVNMTVQCIGGYKYICAFGYMEVLNVLHLCMDDINVLKPAYTA